MAKIVIPEASEDAKRDQFLAERADIFRMAYALIDSFEWESEPSPLEVLGVAQFLAGDTIE